MMKEFSGLAQHKRKACWLWQARVEAERLELEFSKKRPAMRLWAFKVFTEVSLVSGITKSRRKDVCKDRAREGHTTNAPHRGRCERGLTKS